jgi:ADP-ribosylglycohydrolase
MADISKEQRIQNALKALTGVSIGDAFGDSFFGDPESISGNIQERTVPATSKWEFTDDTVMSIAVFEELELDGTIDQTRLVAKFCRNHNHDPNRGYGATARRILREIEAGETWETVSKNAFEGQGSMGNGAAMRVCPIGAYYYDDLQKVKELAKLSAEVTHYNHEAIVGAMAVAVATALAARFRFENIAVSPIGFIDLVLAELPGSDTTSKISKSKSVSSNYHMESIRSILGNGVNMTSQDTVPFVIWCAAHHLYHFEEALWKAVSILGDRDTICAMVAGIVVLSSPEHTVPEAWKNSVESIETSMFRS